MAMLVALPATISSSVSFAYLTPVITYTVHVFIYKVGTPSGLPPCFKIIANTIVIVIDKLTTVGGIGRRWSFSALCASIVLGGNCTGNEHNNRGSHQNSCYSLHIKQF